jgi:hypothetical protein
MRIFRKPNFTIFLAALMLFISCTQNEKDFFHEEQFKEVNYNQESYSNMLKTLKKKIDNLLLERKPLGLSLEEYKVELIKGKYSLTELDKNKILSFTTDLNNYGEFIAMNEGLNFDRKDKSELFATAGLLSPKVMTMINVNQNKLHAKMMPDWSVIATCAAIAVGADILWSLGDSSVKWTTKSIVKAFSKVAKRFLGPVGVAIAIVSFGMCIAEHSID